MSVAPAFRTEAQSSRFPFPSYFTGWYRVCGSKDLRPSKPVVVQAFGQDFVVFRSGDGVARVLDAYCPHLGAHLGDGTLQGGMLACPFHGWRFDGEGRCVGTPAGGRTPNAQVRSWTSAEIDGALLLWFSPSGEAPSFWPKAGLEEDEARHWTRRRSGRARIARTHVQELAENGVDTAHFAETHGFHIASAETMEFEINGSTLRHLIRQSFNIFGLGRIWPNAATGLLEFAYQGMGIVNVYAQTPGFLKVRFLTTLYFTPVDSDHCRVTADYCIRRRGPLTPLLFAISRRGAETAIESDVELLERKRYLSRPHLHENDGPIMRYRHWAAQFSHSGRAKEDA